MRIILLRLLIGWWMIPATWVLVWPLLWLLSSVKGEAAYICRDLTHSFWRGV